MSSALNPSNPNRSPNPVYRSPTDLPSPLTHKRLRTESAAVAAHEANEGLFCFGLPLDAEGDVSMNLNTPSSSDLATITIATLPTFSTDNGKPDTDGKPNAELGNHPNTLPSGLQRSLAKLDADSHAVRLRQVQLEQSDKQTARTYSLAIQSYEKWWCQYQTQLHAEDPQWTTIPAFPITAAKVVMFLEYETTRPKVNYTRCNSF